MNVSLYFIVNQVLVQDSENKYLYTEQLLRLVAKY